MTEGFAEKILAMPRRRKRALALLVDSALCVITVSLAYLLRLDRWVWPVGPQWLSYFGALVIAVPLFISFGLYRAIFRFVGWTAFVSVLRASALYGAAYSFIFTLIGVSSVPRTVGVLQPILLFLAVGTSRAFARYWLGGGLQNLLQLENRRRVLIYGAGAAGRQLAAAFGGDNKIDLVGFIDDDKTLQGSAMNGRQIYSADKLAALIQELAVDDVLLAIPSASRQRRNAIIGEIRGTGTSVRTLPGIMDLAHGRVTVSDLRELDIEDLLGRDPVLPDDLLLGRRITGRVVMVTGAGGSIGGEICRQILMLSPSTLVLLEQSEFNLYAIHQDLQQRSGALGSVEIVPLLASVQDRERVSEIMRQWSPQTIYHAAAYKHVPLVEANPGEAVLNNVFGTQVMAECAREHGVADFVLISTDKAVRPTNVMGATKRLAEQVLQAIAAEGGGTRFCMVRFGNVLGSSGSVVPLFRQQIAAGGPVTITHEEVTRYFMTIPEAAQLVLQAGAMAEGGEVFVLDMGNPVRIADLAEKMIELSGLTVRSADRPDGDIDIAVVGLRPGEKLYEELLIGNCPEGTGHPRIMKAAEGFPSWAKLGPDLLELRATVRERDDTLLRASLSSLVPEYRSPLSLGEAQPS